MQSAQLPLPGVLSDLDTQETEEPTQSGCTAMEILTHYIAPLARILLSCFEAFDKASLCRVIDTILQWLAALVGRLAPFTTP